MTSDDAVENIRAGFVTGSEDARLMMRWWWFGPFVDDTELDRELTSMAAAGIGGVEVAFEYPLSIGADDEGFLSERHLASLRFAAERARELGMRFDVTLGSGWSFGGPHVTPEHAAHQLRWDRRDIAPGAHDIPVPTPWPGDELVAAYLGDGSLEELPHRFAVVPVAAGLLRIPAGSGPRVILLAYSSLSGQNVKRASVGSEGYMFDHYNAAASLAHLDAVGGALLGAVPAEWLGSVFCDSVEVYGANWTPGFLAEFERRRGYDATPELYRLVVDGAGLDGGEAATAAFRVDFYRTLTEVYEENFVAVAQRWAAERGVPFRIQSYGQPPAVPSTYRFADRFEGEGWGWKEVTATKWASSAAHLYGQTVASSEVWTWVHSPSFRATPLDLKGEAHEHFLLGINQLIGHGWPYSPSDAEGVGWMLYASGALDDRNPWWPVMPELAAYLRRASWLLQQGEPVSDIGVYAPVHDVYTALQPGTRNYLNVFLGTKQHIGTDIPSALLDNGYNYELFDDAALDVLDRGRFAAIVLPRVSILPADTRRWLDEYVAGGGTVIAVGGAVGGAAGRASRWRAVPDAAGLPATLVAATAPDVVFSPLEAELGFVHRALDGVDVYFVANTSSERRTTNLRPRTARASFDELNLHTGEVVRSGTLADGVELSLEPYEAAVLVAHDGEPGGAAGCAGAAGIAAAADAGVADAVGVEELALPGPWTVAFGDAAESEPAEVTLPHRWEDLPGRLGYSGSARYETTFDLAGDAGPEDAGPGGAAPGGTASRRAVLSFGDALPTDLGETDEVGIRGASFRAHVTSPVGAVARVALNGRPAGFVWAPPFELDVTDLVRAGSNALSIEVFNTGANALSADKTLPATVAAVTAKYGRRFELQDVELALDGLSSGLLRSPTLRIR